MLNIETVCDFPVEKTALLKKLAERLMINPSFATHKEVSRYLQIFAMEIGCDFPNEKTLRNLLEILSNKEEENLIEMNNFIFLLEACLNIYNENKKVPLGGIFERVLLQLQKFIHSNGVY